MLPATALENGTLKLFAASEAPIYLMHLVLRHGEEPPFGKASEQMRLGGKSRLSSAGSQGRLKDIFGTVLT